MLVAVYQSTRYYIQLGHNADSYVCGNQSTKKSDLSKCVRDLKRHKIVVLVVVIIIIISSSSSSSSSSCSKVLPQQAEVAQGVPGRLRPRIFVMFGTTRVVGRQPYAPAPFTPGEIPSTHFQRLIRPQGAWFFRGSHRKNPQ